MLCATGLWKLGSCFEKLLDTRTHDGAHYNPKYFNRNGAICVAYGIASKVLAATLESTGIQYLKYTLRVGVNSKDSDDVPHDGYSFSKLAALYLVPVVARITTQTQFFQEHVSYYMGRMQSTKEERKLAAKPYKEERKLVKRVAKLAELMEFIPLRLLSEAFQPWRQSSHKLKEYQELYGLPQSQSYIYFELRDMYWKIFEEAPVTVSGQTTEEDDDDEPYIPALHGEYTDIAGVLSNGNAVLDFSMSAPVSSLVRLNPNWVG